MMSLAFIIVMIDSYQGYDRFLGLIILNRFSRTKGNSNQDKRDQ